MPAKAGIQKAHSNHWIPAYAGMTTKQRVYLFRASLGVGDTLKITPPPLRWQMFDGVAQHGARHVVLMADEETFQTRAVALYSAFMVFPLLVSRELFQKLPKDRLTPDVRRQAAVVVGQLARISA